MRKMANTGNKPEARSDLLFPVIFTLALLATAANLELLLGAAKSNPIFMGLFLLSSVVVIWRGKLVPAFSVAVVIAVFGTLLSALLTSFPLFDWNVYFRALVSFLVPFLFLIAVPRTSDRDFVLLALSWFALANLAIGVVYQIVGLHQLFAIDVAGVRRLGGATLPAFLGAAAAVGAFASLLLAEQKKQRFYFALGLVNFIILAFTAGRMAAAVAFACCAAIYIWRFHNQLKAKLVVLLVGALIGMPLGAIVFERLLKRSGSEGLQGRDLIWGYLLTYQHEYPYFGIGLGLQQFIVPEQVQKITGTTGSHNEYLHFLVQCGWIGSAFIAAALLFILLGTWSSARMRYNPVYITVVIAFLVFSVTDNAWSRPEMFLLLVAASYGCGLSCEELDEQNRQAHLSRQQSPGWRLAAPQQMG